MWGREGCDLGQGVGHAVAYYANASCGMSATTEFPVKLQSRVRTERRTARTHARKVMGKSSVLFFIFTGYNVTCYNKWRWMMTMVIHHGHKIVSHAKLGMQSQNLRCTRCSDLVPPLGERYRWSNKISGLALRSRQAGRLFVNQASQCEIPALRTCPWVDVYTTVTNCDSAFFRWFTSNISCRDHVQTDAEIWPTQNNST